MKQYFTVLDGLTASRSATEPGRTGLTVIRVLDKGNIKEYINIL